MFEGLALSTIGRCGLVGVGVAFLRKCVTVGGHSDGREAHVPFLPVACAPMQKSQLLLQHDVYRHAAMMVMD